MINYKKDIDNIVTLTLDMAGRDVNVINHEIMDVFLPIIKHLSDEKNKKELKGIIITSAKKTFLTGGDLDYLYQAKDPASIFPFTQKLKKFFRDLESPGVPVVAAISGSALGSGCELALACHHRIIIDEPRIRIGHPEVHLGLIPGGGGLTRLMWILGIERAFPILANGRKYAPKEAQAVGLVDELAVDKADMLRKAKTWIMENPEGRRLWDQKGASIPGGSANDPKVARIVSAFAAGLSAKTFNNYPAPQAILDTMIAGSKVDFDTACRIESRYFTKLLRSPQTKNMIKAFWYDLNAIKAGANRPKGIGKFRPKKVGIIGAGMMGSSIAYSCAKLGLEVVLKDISKSVAEIGKSFTEKQLAEMLAIGKITKAEQIAMLDRIQTTENVEDFATCDIVIEVVFENQMVKAKAIKEAEASTDEFSIIASNTLSIPITKLASASNRPENFVGLHFFPPAHEVPLVEIVRGKETSDETVARAFDFAKLMRKTPIIVKDNWGFFVGRVQNTYILEGITLLQEGVAPSLIENLGLTAGMSKSPLELADDLSLPIILKYENQAAEHYGTKYIRHPAVNVLSKMIEELERKGKQKKAGFYDYEAGEKTQLWADLSSEFPQNNKAVAPIEIVERLLFVQVLESVWCLQEKVIQSEADGNLGSIYGWGFPGYKGGVFQFINDYGLAAFIEKCKIFEERFGPRFIVPKLLLKKMVVQN